MTLDIASLVGDNDGLSGLGGGDIVGTGRSSNISTGESEDDTDDDEEEEDEDESTTFDDELLAGSAGGDGLSLPSELCPELGGMTFR